VLVAIDLNHVGGSVNPPHHEEGGTTTSIPFSMFDPLWNDPRFQKLAASPAPQTAGK
jgi:hypothetical protein